MGGTIFGVGPLEVVMIAIIILLVFGPERFPELMRNLGKGVRGFRKFLASFTDEFKDDIAPIASELHEATKDLREDLSQLRDVASLGNLIPSINLDGTEQAQLPASGEVGQIAPPGAPSANTPTDLAEDNPWASGETAPSTQMDEDNPWRG
ncbi:MAG TPA: twin-arginine translocase TatA/TatE family subunit [Thermoflexales bacterium]|nr:twin-arginine translocase TatA/TatE family subunit [Thermoflexales bacterium]HQW36224.1 twin-arginine translocase TatA/TatE family subunit [Thermoflexales bacterium]HQX75828.1 twin-arginine translocase TatA/TatE family subunit [Thermoflexales bacterium]HQZ22445.1 twin-arginine translocase TatA/TatE family subunit [Thermoflexales bacterium]HQZ99134.1 twin-arginine translocase TatA/TatE family subunit [Thermoflexales bacterium]